MLCFQSEICLTIETEPLLFKKRRDYTTFRYAEFLDFNSDPFRFAIITDAVVEVVDTQQGLPRERWRIDEGVELTIHFAELHQLLASHEEQNGLHRFGGR